MGRIPQLRALATEWRQVVMQLSEARSHRHETPIDPLLRLRYTTLSPEVRKLRRDFDSEHRAKVYLSILQHVGFHPVMKHRPDGATVRAY